jgi:hypothetical protein
VVWQRDVLAEATVFADPSAGRIGYVAGNVIHQVDLATGAEETADGVRAATYTASGTLVMVTVDGRIHWAATPAGRRPG